MLPSECKVTKLEPFVEYEKISYSGLHFVRVYPGNPPMVCAWAACESNSWELLPLTMTIEELREFVKDALVRVGVRP